jgi:hypothetical protein
MLFSQLHLERIVFELRYDAGYLYWDHSGRVLYDMIGQFPKFEVRAVQLAGTQAEWTEEGLVFNFNNEKLDITQNEVGSVKLFKEVSAHLCSVIFTHLKLKTFTRAGVRFFYVYPTKSKDEADKLLSTSKLFCAETKETEPFGRIVERELMLRIEGENRGYAIRLSAATRQVIRSGIAKPLSINTDKFHSNVVILDVDSYTKKAGDVAILSVPDFIRTSERTLEENLIPLVGISDGGDEKQTSKR